MWGSLAKLIEENCEANRIEKSKGDDNAHPHSPSFSFRCLLSGAENFNKSPSFSSRRFAATNQISRYNYK